MLEIEFSMKFERELRCVKLLSSIQSPVKKSQVYTYMYDILLVFTKEVTKPQNHKIPLNSTCQFLDCTAASPATNLWLSGHTFGKVAVAVMEIQVKQWLAYSCSVIVACQPTPQEFFHSLEKTP